jgi:TM2 domain-containing membrane protein YozV
MSEEMTGDERDGNIELTHRELEDAKSKKMMAGILAILLGGLGIHKFVLGITTPGLIMLLVSVLTCFVAYPVMHVIGIIEGVMYLTKSDQEFYQTYIIEKKAWL